MKYEHKAFTQMRITYILKDLMDEKRKRKEYPPHIELKELFNKYNEKLNKKTSFIYFKQLVNELVDKQIIRKYTKNGKTFVFVDPIFELTLDIR